MLIKANSITYKTKINAKIKPKKENRVCPNSESCIKENRTRNLIKKQVLVRDCHRNLFAP